MGLCLCLDVAQRIRASDLGSTVGERAAGSSGNGWGGVAWSGRVDAIRTTVGHGWVLNRSVL
jgi:hypothetical protein